MDKNEILEKSRIENENGDERQQMLIKNGGNISALVASVLCVIFAFIRMFILNESITDLYIILISMNATNNIVQYINLKKKINLTFSICYITAIALLLIAYIIKLIG